MVTRKLLADFKSYSNFVRGIPYRIGFTQLPPHFNTTSLRAGAAFHSTNFLKVWRRLFKNGFSHINLNGFIDLNLLYTAVVY